MRRRCVASTSVRRHVIAGNLLPPPLPPPQTFPPNILNLRTPMGFMDRFYGHQPLPDCADVGSKATLYHNIQIFSTKYPVTCKVFIRYHGTSAVEHGLYGLTVDKPLAKAQGLSRRAGAQTMLVVTDTGCTNLKSPYLHYQYNIYGSWVIYKLKEERSERIREVSLFW